MKRAEDACSVILDFIVHTLIECPQVFVGSNNANDATPDLAEQRAQRNTTEEEQCQGTTDFKLFPRRNKALTKNPQFE